MITVISKREQIKIAIFAVIACFSILYLAPKVPTPSNIGPLDFFDFQTFWVVGKIWASGQNPYDVDLFQKQFYDAIHRSAGEIMWLYPPYWYLIIVPFAFLPFKIAFGIWKVINVSLLIAATHLIARAIADTTRQKYILIFLAGIAFVFGMQATAKTVWGGQTSIFVYFGISALIFGLLKGRQLLLILGLVFLALKPQIGIIAFAAVSGLRPYRWTLLPAAGICILGSLPVAIAVGYYASIQGFLANLALQSKTVSYGADLITGVSRILDYQSYITNSFVISLTVMVSAMTLAFFVFYNSSLNSGRGVAGAQGKIADLALFVATMFFFAPLHSYDLVSLVAILMMIVGTPLAGRWLIGIGLLICLRPENLLDAIAIVSSENLLLSVSHLVSAGLLLIFVGAAWSGLVGDRKQKDGYVKSIPRA